MENNMMNEELMMNNEALVDELNTVSDIDYAHEEEKRNSGLGILVA